MGLDDDSEHSDGGGSSEEVRESYTTLVWPTPPLKRNHIPLLTKHAVVLFLPQEDLLVQAVGLADGQRAALQSS